MNVYLELNDNQILSVKKIRIKPGEELDIRVPEINFSVDISWMNDLMVVDRVWKLLSSILGLLEVKKLRAVPAPIKKQVNEENVTKICLVIQQFNLLIKDKDPVLLTKLENIQLDLSQ